MKDFLYVGLIAFVSGAAFCFFVIKASMLPDVHFSYSTGECVEVLNYVEDEIWDCENLPEKFYHVWVE
jgi:hypothetical protein